VFCTFRFADFCVEDLDKQRLRVTSIKGLPWAPDYPNYA
jgi:hypothetical protein